MIKHVVMWKLKDHAEGADRAANATKLKALLDGCRDIVPGLVEFEVALAHPGLEATYDVVLYSVFADKAALRRVPGPSEARRREAFHRRRPPRAPVHGLRNLKEKTCR